jgi:Holliday junction resolvase
MKLEDYKSQIDSKKSESEVSKQIVDYIKASGFTVYRMNAGKAKVNGGYIQLAPKGTPDLLANVYGFILWIEVKKKGGKATLEQAECHAELSKYSYVIFADTFDSFQMQFALAETHLRLKYLRSK